jgi:hypothetical protein
MFWKQVIKPMCSRQQALNKLLIDWCLPMSFSGEKQNDIGHASWQSDHCLAFTRISLFPFADIDGMFGDMCPTQLNCVIASFKCMQAVWFCLVSNMFCDMAFISTNRVDHLISMFLSSVTTSLSIQKKPVVIHCLLLNQTSSVRWHLGRRG